MATSTIQGNIETYLGAKADSLLGFKSPKIAKERLHLPGPDFVDRIYASTDRNLRVLTNLQRMFGHGRLSGTGYLSILPVDQGIEHSGGASFAKNPDYFDGGNIVKLAIEGGCNAVQVIFMVTGADKAPALKAVLEGPFEPEQLPAQLLQPKNGKLLWLVDAAAGSMLR